MADLYKDREARIREVVSDFADPDLATWLIVALSNGIGMKESTGLPSPEPERLGAAITTALTALSWEGRG